jgi:hypothetical protein
MQKNLEFPVIPLTIALSKRALAGLLAMGVLTISSWAGDLSAYRNFRFGSDVATVAKLAFEDPADAEVIQTRPARIEVLAWRPQSLGGPVGHEAVKDVVFTFYEGELYRIAVNYDRYETAGMTDADVVESISAVFGPSKPVSDPAKVPALGYGDPEELIARWEDAGHTFDLTRTSYGPTYKLVGVLTRLVSAEKASTTEAARLDTLEAPQREAEAAARLEEIAQDKLEKARLLNKEKFRP